MLDAAPESARRRSLVPHPFAALALGIACAAWGCDEGTPETPPAGGCVVDSLDRQPVERFVAGETFYLPRVDAACAGAWRQVDGPPDNPVVAGTDGWSRIVPLAPGAHVFRHDSGDVEDVRLTVVADAPFEHFNYYGVQSALPVGDELWVAQVFAPEIVRLDPETLAERGRVRTGGWPVSMALAGSEVVVAQRADDTLGFVDRADGRLLDAVWVGDEPAHVVTTPEGDRAFVALATEGAVAVVDVATRSVIGRVETNPDPMAMALDAPRGRLYVASHRSAQGDRFPFGEDPRGDVFDIAVVDVSELAVVDYIEAVGSTINGLLVADGALFTATTRSNPSESLANIDGGSFRHEVVRYAIGDGTDGITEVARADLSRQDSSTGWAVTAHGLALVDGTLWVAIEGSDAAIGLDPQTLEEVRRVDAPGRPRAVVGMGSRVFVHGAQGFAVTAVDGDSAQTATLDGDPRSPAMALGQAYFTGAGENYGANHACNSCHLDAIMDGNVWKAGPFDLWAVTRPFFWLEGTFPLGWEGYLTDARNFAVTVGSTIAKNPTTEEARALAAYVTALVPPPAANGATRRDGGLTEAARRGEAVFDGAGTCVSCHAGPLGTSRQVLAEGVTPGPTDIPSLVGAYRYGYWLKSGNPRTLGETVEAKIRWLDLNLGDDEVADLVAWLEGYTARDAFLLTSDPAEGSVAPLVGDIRLIFSHPLLDDAENRARLTLRALPDRTPVAATVRVDGRYVTLSPEAPLMPSTGYVIDIPSDLQTFRGLPMTGAKAVGFTTQAAPMATFEGAYRWRVQFPAFDRANQRLDPETTSAVDVALVAEPTAFGATVTVTMNETLSADVPFVLDGDALEWPAIAVPLGGTAFASGWPTRFSVEDRDGDGVVDGGRGAMRVSGPGFDQEDVEFELERVVEDACPEESTGTHTLAVEFADGLPTIDWGAEPLALAAYVTEPGARLPLGPGTVSGGATYWGVQATNFPTGFAGPVVYGETPADAMDVSEANGAPAGGAELPAGACVTLHVQYADFSTSTVTRVVP